VFEHVLGRIEEDLGKEAVEVAVEAIWASRGGLLREELLEVAQMAKIPSIRATRADRGHDCLHRYFNFLEV
jgi:hypothetical protein